MNLSLLPKHARPVRLTVVEASPSSRRNSRNGACARITRAQYGKSSLKFRSTDSWWERKQPCSLMATSYPISEYSGRHHVMALWRFGNAKIKVSHPLPANPQVPDQKTNHALARLPFTCASGSTPIFAPHATTRKD